MSGFFSNKFQRPRLWLSQPRGRVWLALSQNRVPRGRDRKTRKWHESPPMTPVVGETESSGEEKANFQDDQPRTMSLVFLLRIRWWTGGLEFFSRIILKLKTWNILSFYFEMPDFLSNFNDVWSFLFQFILNYDKSNISNFKSRDFYGFKFNTKIQFLFFSFNLVQL